MAELSYGQKRIVDSPLTKILNEFKRIESAEQKYLKYKELEEIKNNKAEGDKGS